MEFLTIPPIFHDCLFMAADGTVSEADIIAHYFWLKEDEILLLHSAYLQKQLFIEFYLLAKKQLELKWVYKKTSDTLGGQISVEICHEQDLLNLINSRSDSIQVHAFFDMPINWYVEKNNIMGKSLLKEACYISFVTYPRFEIVIHYEFFLFTNHLFKRSVERLPEVPPIYFEPAAKLNREILRNFAKAVEQKFPMLYVEFSTEVATKPPADKYGFPDDADDFYYEEWKREWGTG